MDKTEIRIPWDEEGSLAMAHSLLRLGIDCRFPGHNGEAELLISMDQEQDDRVRALVDALCDVRARYEDAKA